MMYAFVAREEYFQMVYHCFSHPRPEHLVLALQSCNTKIDFLKYELKSFRSL